MEFRKERLVMPIPTRDAACKALQEEHCINCNKFRLEAQQQHMPFAVFNKTIDRMYEGYQSSLKEINRLYDRLERKRDL